MTPKNRFAALMATLPPSAVDAAFGYLGSERVTAALQANDTPDKKKQLMGAMRLWVYASMQDVHQLLSAALRREISQDCLYQYLEKGFLTASLKGWVEEDHLQAGEWLSAIERQLMVPASELRSRVFRERNIIADLGQFTFAFQTRPRRVFRLSLQPESVDHGICVYDLAKSTDAVFLAAVLTGTASSVEKSLEAHKHLVRMKAVRIGEVVDLLFTSVNGLGARCTSTASIPPSGQKQMREVFLDEYLRLGLNSEDSFVDEVARKLKGLQQVPA